MSLCLFWTERTLAGISIAHDSDEAISHYVAAAYSKRPGLSPQIQGTVPIQIVAGTCGACDIVLWVKYNASSCQRLNDELRQGTLADMRTRW